MKKTEPKVAFIGWNPFQLIHVSTLIKSLSNSIFILEKKHNNLKQFSHELINDPNIPVIICKSENLHQLDGVYDVIVCQTAFTDIHKFSKTKIAMVQYGYAKESHNYGSWRSFADICFTYGPYAAKKISYFCPTINIGFLRKEAVEPQYIEESKSLYKHLLVPNKKTILYLPTWGSHKSDTVYLKKIATLKNQYNVIIKEHHNTHLLGFKPTKIIKDKTESLGVNDDVMRLIAITDIVITDFSGAIFDAIFCKKPVIILNSKNPNNKSRLDKDSIEYKRREELGYIINQEHELEQTIQKAINDKENYISEELYQQLFSTIKNPFKIVKQEIDNLFTQKNLVLTKKQILLREETKDIYASKYISFKYKISNYLYLIYTKLMK